jgi:hypothetical protein
LEGDKLAAQFRPDHPGGRFKAEVLEGPGDVIGESGEAAGAVPAHLRFAAIGVVVTHPEIRPIARPLQDEDAIGSHSAMAIAKPGNFLPAEDEIAGAVIEENEIVPGAVHFREAQHATCWLAQTFMKAKPAPSRPCSSADFPYWSAVRSLLRIGLLFALTTPVASARLAPSPLNAVILEQIRQMPVGGKYSTTRAATIRLKSAAHFESGKFFILPDAASPSYCSGATYLVFIKTIETLRRRGELTLGYETLDALMVRNQRDGEGIWGRWNANGPGTARLFHELGLGRNFDDFAEAEPGDFMKIFWSDDVGRTERGHSVIYLGQENKLGVEHVRYWSSNLPGGYGEKSVPRSKIARAIFSRLYAPANLERIQAAPAVDRYLASLLRVSSSFLRAREECGF